MNKFINQHRNSFATVAMYPSHPNWEKAIERLIEDKPKDGEIRSEFDRDCGRILHSLAFSRLKSKTQVFFHTNDDRICTRIEHVHHVMSISSTIARFLGLNSELTYAMAMGHDLGHSPFGHKGEDCLHKLCKEFELGEFWHEQNSLHVVDCLELLLGNDGKYHHLNLSYAVRDGIISHCGEVNQKSLTPRKDACNLNVFSKQYRENPFTWEACVVKISDKIAYLGRDLEDALRLNILDNKQMDELNKQVYKICGLKTANNTNLIHTFITDLCKESSPEKGLAFSPPVYELMVYIMQFNYKNIYGHPRLKMYDSYANLILNSIFEVLYKAYTHKDKSLNNYTNLNKDFSNYLNIHDPDKKNARSIIDFVSLLTDRAAIDYFKELTSF